MDMTLGDTQLILKECRSKNILRNQVAYILATAYWETAHTVKPVREAFWMSEDWRRKNLRYYPWYGRGYVQLTWKRNYERAGRELNVDMTTDADVAMQPEIAAKVLVKGMMFGWFTGKALPEYVTLQSSDFEGARRVVNGTDKAREIADIARDYDRTLRDMGYGEAAATDKPSGIVAAILAALRAIFGGKK